MMARTLSVLLPALDEEDCIEVAVDAAVGAGETLVERGVVSSYEVVVVDDGSTDRTPEIVDELSRGSEHVVGVHHTRNRGLGAAVRTGLAHASGELVFYTDADLPVDLSAIGTAIDLLGSEPGADVVCAYRRRRGSEGPRRYVYSLAYNALVRVVFGIPVRDVNFAAKLLRRDALEDLDLRSEGSFIDAELLGRLHRRGHRVLQFPADYRARSQGVSTLSSAPVILHILREMRWLAPEIRRERPRVSTRS